MPEGLDRVGALLGAAVASGRIPGIVAMAGRGGATLGRWVTGQADAIRGRPMRADTVFDLASLTKVVATTTVTLALASRGQLGLGDLALDPATGLWVVLLTNAVHSGRDHTAVQALRRAVHAAVRVTGARPP